MNFQSREIGTVAGCLVATLHDLVRKVHRSIVDMLVPPGCLLCNKPASEPGALCAGCWPKVHFVDRPYCEILGLPFDYDHGNGAVSPGAIADPPPFDRMRCAVIYGDEARRLVSDLKFADRTELAPWMARWMAVAGRELLHDCDMIAPVPLHWFRLHQRRYNQAAELARTIARLSGVKYCPDIIVRNRGTRRQVGLSADERKRNVQGAFRVPIDQRPVVQGRRILLVDDVHTSGATVRASARAVARAGACGIDVLVFASVMSDHISND